MKNFVLDSFALLVFFEKQKDWQKVERYLIDAVQDKIELHMSVINYGEVFYIIGQKVSVLEASDIIHIVDTLPIKISIPDKNETLKAALYKINGGISYADCFAAALAKKHKAKLITGDPEFKKLNNEIEIDWIEK